MNAINNTTKSNQSLNLESARRDSLREDGPARGQLLRVPSRVASCRILRKINRRAKTKTTQSRHRALFIPKEGKETLEVNLKKERTRRGLATKSWVRESVMRREGISTPTHP